MWRKRQCSANSSSRGLVSTQYSVISHLNQTSYVCSIQLSISFTASERTPRLPLHARRPGSRLLHGQSHHPGLQWAGTLPWRHVATFNHCLLDKHRIYYTHICTYVYIIYILSLWSFQAGKGVDILADTYKYSKYTYKYMGECVLDYVHLLHISIYIYLISSMRIYRAMYSSSVLPCFQVVWSVANPATEALHITRKQLAKLYSLFMTPAPTKN